MSVSSRVTSPVGSGIASGPGQKGSLLHTGSRAGAARPGLASGGSDPRAAVFPHLVETHSPEESMRRPLRPASLAVLAALAVAACSGDSPTAPRGLAGLLRPAAVGDWIAFQTGAGIERIRPDGSGRTVVFEDGTHP